MNSEETIRGLKAAHALKGCKIEREGHRGGLKDSVPLNTFRAGERLKIYPLYATAAYKANQRRQKSYPIESCAPLLKVDEDVKHAQDNIDPLIAKVELALQKVCHASLAVQRKAAELDFLESVKSLSTILDKHARSNSYTDRQLLQELYGGDFERFARIRNVIDTVVLDCKIVVDCRNHCDSIQAVLEDLGGCKQVRGAIALQKKAMMRRLSGLETDWYEIEYADSEAEQATVIQDYPLGVCAFKFDDHNIGGSSCCQCARGDHMAQDHFIMTLIKENRELKQENRGLKRKLDQLANPWDQ